MASYLDRVLDGAKIRYDRAVDDPIGTAKGLGLGAVASVPGAVSGIGDLIGAETPMSDEAIDALRRRAGNSDLAFAMGEVLGVPATAGGAIARQAGRARQADNVLNVQPTSKLVHDVPTQMEYNKMADNMNGIAEQSIKRDRMISENEFKNAKQTLGDAFKEGSLKNSTPPASSMAKGTKVPKDRLSEYNGMDSFDMIKKEGLLDADREAINAFWQANPKLKKRALRNEAKMNVDPQDARWENEHLIDRLEATGELPYPKPKNKKEWRLNQQVQERLDGYNAADNLNDEDFLDAMTRAMYQK